jgi:hypothetical protein
MSSETPGVVNQIEYQWNQGGLQPVAWSFGQKSELEDWQHRISHLVRAPKRPEHEADRASVVYVATGPEDMALLLRRRSSRLAAHRAGDDRFSLITRVLTGPLELLTPAAARGLVRCGGSALHDPKQHLAAHDVRLPELGRLELQQLELSSQQSARSSMGVAQSRWCRALVTAALSQVDSMLGVVLPPVEGSGPDRSELAEHVLVDALAVVGPVLAGMRIGGLPEGWGCSFSTYQELLANHDLRQLPRIVLCDDPGEGAPTMRRRSQWLSMRDSDTRDDWAGHDRAQLAQALVEAFDEHGEAEYCTLVTKYVSPGEGLEARLDRLGRVLSVPPQQGRGTDAPAEHGHLTTANEQAQGSAGSAVGEDSAARRLEQASAADLTAAEDQKILAGQTTGRSADPAGTKDGGLTRGSQMTTTARTGAQATGPGSASREWTGIETPHGGFGTGARHQVPAEHLSPGRKPSSYENGATEAVRRINDHVNRTGALELWDQQNCLTSLRDYAGPYVAHLSQTCPHDLPDQLRKTVEKIVLPALRDDRASAADTLEWLSRPATPADLVSAVHASGALDTAVAIDLRERLLFGLGMRWLREHRIHPDPMLWPKPTAHLDHPTPPSRPWWMRALTPFAGTVRARWANSLYWVCLVLLMTTLYLTMTSCGTQSTDEVANTTVNPTQPHTPLPAPASRTNQAPPTVQPGHRASQDVSTSVPQELWLVPTQGGQNVTPALQQPSSAAVAP